jgi:hypothetical protein
MAFEALLRATSDFQTSSDLDLLDPKFAETFVNRAEALLQTIEQRTLTYLQTKQARFNASDEFVYMVAHVRAVDSPNVRAYISLLLFLHNRVRKEGIVRWKGYDS